MTRKKIFPATRKQIMIFLISLLLIIIPFFQAHAQKYRTDRAYFMKIVHMDINTDTLPNFIVSLKTELKQANEKQDIYKMALNNLYLAKLYFKIGSFDIAIDYNLKALKYFEEIKDTTFWIFSLQNISAMYGFIGNDSASIKYSLKNLELSKAIHDTSFIEGAEINLGASYLKYDIKKAMEYYDDAIYIAKNYEDKKGLDYIYNNIATFYYKNNQYDSAIYYFNKSLAAIKDKKNSPVAAIIYFNLSEAYYYSGNYKYAEKFARKAINTYQKTQNVTFTTATAYLVFVKSLAKMERPDSIPEYLGEYYDIEQTVIKNFKSEQTSKLNVLYELNKYENKIKLLQAENKIKKTKLLLAGIILIIIF